MTNDYETEDTNLSNKSESSEGENSTDETTEGSDESEESSEGESDSDEGEQEDYREKLNIQNRFLKKEGYEFKNGRWQKPTSNNQNAQSSSNKSNGDLTTRDLYALMDAKVPQDDVNEVVEYATLKKISISEALKSTVVKAILAEKAEYRNSAKASNTGSARRGTSKVSDEALLENFKKGIVPDSDEEISRLVKLRAKK